MEIIANTNKRLQLRASEWVERQRRAARTAASRRRNASCITVTCDPHNVAYITGPILGRYLNNFPEFDRVKRELVGDGYTAVLSASDIPASLPDSNRVDIRSAMIRASSVVVLLSGWAEDPMAILDEAYARKIETKTIEWARLCE